MSAYSYLRGLFGGSTARAAEAIRAIDLEAEQFASKDATTARTGDLRKEIARPAIGSILSAQRFSEADKLTPTYLATIMREADQGNVRAYLTLADEMEERETHYASVLATRKLGVSGAPTSVTAADDSAHSKAIADHVEQIMQRPEAEALVIDLMDAVAKSFSCVEIIWQRDAKTWEPLRYEHREARHFTFDRDTLSTPRLLSLEHTYEGEALAPFKWLVHKPRLRSGVPIRTGIARPVAIAYAAKRWTVADWLAFMDVFGMPIRVGKYPSNMADRKRELLRAVQAIGHDAAGVIPKEMEIELLESKGGAGGTTLFQQSAEYWDKQISKVVLGQTMSSDDGASLAQSKTHERVRFDIRKADARAIAATINRDLIKPLVDLNYGPQDAYPKLLIQCDEPEDTTALMGVVKIFVGLGGKVQMSEVRDRIGLAEPEDGAELLLPEVAVAAALAPKPAPGEPAAPGKPADKAGTDPAAEGDGISGDGRSAELNRDGARGEAFAAKPKTRDTIDDIVDGELADWEQLLDGTVGEAMRQLAAAGSYEAARAVLEQLQRDRADLDIGPLVTSLAKRQFQCAGIGDASDKPEV